MIPIAIAEDNRSFRDTLREAMESFDDLKVPIVAKNGKELVHKLLKSETKPQVILMDIDMPLMNGIAATAKVKALAPETKIIIISIYDQEEMVFEAILAGATGYLLKGEKPETIHRAITDALENRLPMSPGIAAIALNMMRGKTKTQPMPESFGLTAREIEILELLAEAKSYKDIAADLFISEKTVRNHIHSIYQKIQVSSKAEAVRMALENQWFR